MLEKIALRFLYYTSRAILIMSFLFLVICAWSIVEAGQDNKDGWSGRDQINFWSDSIGSYWFLRILVVIVVSLITLISVEPYFELEKLKIKQLEDEAKKNNTEK